VRTEARKEACSAGSARPTWLGLVLPRRSFSDNEEAAEPGTVPRRSQGADLAVLLEDAEVGHNQAFLRFRAQLQEVADEAPPLGATADDEVGGATARLELSVARPAVA
jgi:hypothetical protein